MSSSCRPTVATSDPTPRDQHSFSNPDQIAVQDIDLDLAVLFDQRTLKGTATLTVDRPDSAAKTLVLDTRKLQIDNVWTSPDRTNFKDAKFDQGKPDKFLGVALRIEMAPDAKFVKIAYSTDPTASGLQWLTPEQTAGKQNPFLFTQSEAIHARSWIPCQDTPSVRVTYTAHIKTPPHLLALMSAQGNPEGRTRTGDYRFEMKERIPSYLIALAVGDIAFQATGPRTGVYAEPSVVKKAAKEFEDTERMLAATEKLFGPYRWGRYDLLVLPPSFPFGGMENPRLTFATPTVLAGDKSLVALVAHEMAHSWSGNLVTNATWSDFWLNEGFTVYIERRIVEQVYGRVREEMEAALGRQDLEDEMKRLPAKDQILHVDLKGRDPDDGFTEVPYEKGALFLRQMEQVFGRAKFDAYLRGYFDHFAFQSVTTAQSVDYLRKNLLYKDPRSAAAIPVDEWVNKPGLPAAAPYPKSEAFARTEQQAKDWLDGRVPAAHLQTSNWSTQEWLHFLRYLPVKLGATRMQDLDQAFHLTKTGNDEILQQWLLMAVRNGYAPADPRLEEFLTSVGRRKYLKPLYEELAKTGEGKKRARQIYEKARPGYHPIAQTTVDGILK